MNAYKVEVERCDVQDKAALAVFRERRRIWLEAFQSDDPHAIWGQIHQLHWNDALFRTILEAGRLAAEHPTADVGLPSTVVELVAVGFFTVQGTTIRRLVEQPANRPIRAVVSLRTILAEIRDLPDLFTRENYVCFDGAPYDYEPVKHRELLRMSEAALRQGGVAVGRAGGDGMDNWDSAETSHRVFDRLAGVAPSARARTDTMQPRWFELADALLSSCDDVTQFVNKFIAHAAAESTRRGLAADQARLTLDHLDKAYRSIYRVAGFIFGHLLQEGAMGAFPTPQFDHLENLDKRWVHPDTVDDVYQAWRRRAHEMESWHQRLWPDDALGE